MFVKYNIKISKFIIVSLLILFIIMNYFALSYNYMNLMFLGCLMIFITLILLNLITLPTLTLLYVIFIPIAFYIIKNLDINDTIEKYSEYLEFAVFVIILFLNLLHSEKSNKIKFVPKEFILIFLLLFGNFTTFLALEYPFKVFLLTSFIYLKHTIIILIIIYSDINLLSLHKVLKIFSVFIIANLAIAILQFLFGGIFFTTFIGDYYINYRNSFARCTGMFPWSTEFGTFNGIYLIFYYFMGKHYRDKYFYLISVACLANIILSQARLALLMVLIILVLSNIKNLRNQVIVVSLVMILGIFINNYVNIIGFFSESFNSYTNVNNTPRIYYIFKGYEVFRDNPIFGLGFDRFGSRWVYDIEGYEIYTKYNISDFKGRLGEDPEASLGTTDSFIAKILPEFGLYGTILLLVLAGIILYKCLKVVKNNQLMNFALYLLLFSSIYQFNSAHYLFDFHTAPPFWIVVGFIIKEYTVQFTYENADRVLAIYQFSVKK